MEREAENLEHDEYNRVTHQYERVSELNKSGPSLTNIEIE